MFSDVHLPASLVQEEKIVVLLTLEIRRQSLLWMIFDKHLRFPIQLINTLNYCCLDSVYLQ